MRLNIARKAAPPFGHCADTDGGVLRRLTSWRPSPLLTLVLSAFLLQCKSAEPSPSTPKDALSVHYLWGQQLLSCFDEKTGWSSLGLAGLENCAHRPKKPPPPAKSRAVALSKGVSKVRLPMCTPPRPGPLGLTGTEAIEHLRAAVKAKIGHAPTIDMIRIGGAADPRRQRSYEVELDGDSLPDRLITVNGWAILDEEPKPVPTERRHFWNAWLLFPGRAPQTPKVIHLTDAYEYAGLDLKYCSDLDGDGRQELVMMVSGVVELASLEASLGAPARARAKKSGVVDWGYLLVELEGEHLAARGAIYRDQPNY